MQENPKRCGNCLYYSYRIQQNDRLCNNPKSVYAGTQKGEHHSCSQHEYMPAVGSSRLYSSNGAK